MSRYHFTTSLAMFLGLVLSCLTFCRAWAEDARADARASRTLALLVTDPLAKELACDCIAGYAQRRYEALAMVLERRLQRRCSYICGTDIAAYWADDAPLDLIIGKHSEVVCQAEQLGRKVYPLVSLTDSQGRTTLRGLFVVRREDPAQSLQDLQGYRVLFGPESCEEKASAARAALAAAHVAYLDDRQRPPVKTCTDAVNKLLRAGPADRVVAVISDYARVLLEGCHTIPPGSIRVIGRTSPVPFVTVFATEELPAEQRAAIKRELLAANQFATLKRLLESKDGFRAFSAAIPPGDGWTDFRGPRRNGVASALPDAMDNSRVLWTAPLDENGLGGVAATDRWVIVTDRVAARNGDSLKIFSAQTGELAATEELMRPPALQPDKVLDYGSSIRATPVVHGGKIYVLDAYGTLFVCDFPTEAQQPADGFVLGVRTETLTERYRLPTWGIASTPLVVGDRLVVNVSGAGTSLLALDRDDLVPVWRGRGEGTGYASCILATLGGHSQLVGYESKSFSGWDPATGQRLWNIVPDYDGDFNVPSPVAVDEHHLLVATENNGTRLYEFDDNGRPAPKPVAVNEEVSPDTVSPITVGGRAYCTSGDTLFQLDVEGGLAETWSWRDPSLAGHASLIADAPARRLLVLTYQGELLLFDISAAEPRLLSRRNVFAEGVPEEVYSHPAVVGDRMYVRGTNSLVCLEF